ncbi:MAG: hypothetical protein M3Q77_06505 [Thermoproteota archaeon]|nr:hypothetical protein [Nitrosopumilus sp.]MDQ3084450.1 hypothetical protein [Thermoproteota archaeon]
MYEFLKIIKLKPTSSPINKIIFKSEARHALVRRIELQSDISRKYGFLIAENIIPQSSKYGSVMTFF